MRTHSRPIIDKEILDLYFNHVMPNVSLGNGGALKTFREMNPIECRYLSSMTHKRAIIRKNINYMKIVNDRNVAWFTLTFNNDKDKNALRTKQKEVNNFCNNCFDVWLFVEELGTENERYHIHGFGVFKKDADILNTFSSWHSIEKIEMLKGKKLDKKVRYLTKYCAKDIPSIHRSKSLIRLEKGIKSHVCMLRCGFASVFNDDMRTLSSELGITLKSDFTNADKYLL